jgi:hypothetical protein
MVGPKHVKPAAPLARVSRRRPAEKGDSWKISKPEDALVRGEWWELYGDAKLNKLEEQVDPSNQTLKIAEASAADLETARLSLHAELAVDYFQVRSADAREQLLNYTADACGKALVLTKNRFQGGPLRNPMSRRRRRTRRRTCPRHGHQRPARTIRARAGDPHMETTCSLRPATCPAQCCLSDS